mmetsp:Transcript_65472/g.179627  ORF Transcript_65472/g.179627 Transcript_65472/m.179627 type:complete len:229 (-) Transcript_65472:296-982(-)
MQSEEPCSAWRTPLSPLLSFHGAPHQPSPPCGHAAVPCTLGRAPHASQRERHGTRVERRGTCTDRCGTRAEPRGTRVGRPLPRSSRPPRHSRIVVALTSTSPSRVLGHKLLMKGGHPADDRIHLALWRQEGGAEVPRVRLLPEARAGHDDDAGRLEQGERVKGVGHLARSLGSSDGLRRQRDRWEGVHGTLRLVARDPLELIEGSHQHDRTPLERAHDRIALGGIRSV